MDLKIKDVAELLNVSETTIRRWLVEERIPAYRINQQYRFSRTEIESWLMSYKQESLPPVVREEWDKMGVPAGSKQFCLYRAIHKGEVFLDMPGKTKEEIIRSTMKSIAKKMHLDADVLSELFIDREQLQATALNHGIGVPHTRDFLLSAHHDVVVVVFPEQPLLYGALDGIPVHTLFFLFACDDKRHLHLLAKIAHLSSQPEAISLLQSHPSKEGLLDYIKHWESSLHTLKV
jgi:PTS system nitrogen regulatory IIA component